jgi:UDP-2,3-diacylglucosamine hydrolase
MDVHTLPHWRTIDFISDLHLQASEPATYRVWQHYLTQTHADALFILGDWFEVWVGDDVLQESNSFELQCCKLVHQAAQRMAIFVMHGNRDFLIGADCMNACQATLLPDPCVLDTQQQRWLLSHGDALCIDDTDYMHFRKQVRSTAWQNTFLAKPLAERQTIARELRQQSEQRKNTTSSYTDVDTTLALTWLRDANATHMIHGHTHQPAVHLLDPPHQRWVLSDWDGTASPARAEVVRLHLHPDHPPRPERLHVQHAISS